MERLRLLSLLVALVVAGCAPNLHPAVSATSATKAPAQSQALGHVFVIVMENKSPGDVLAAPYASSLARQFAVATNYHAVSAPSVPNYLALTSGSTWDVHDDGYYRLPATGIGYQLTQAGIPWRAYMEGLTGNCFNSPYPYALKHDPFAYYGGECPTNVVPLTALDADLIGDTPNFVWITPNLCHDEHDCSVQAGDQWLATIVPKILASGAWRQNGVLFIVWDEGSSSNSPAAALVVAPRLLAHTTDAYHDL